MNKDLTVGDPAKVLWKFDSFTLDLGEKVMKYSEGKRNA